MGALAIIAFEFFEDFLTKHAFALAVDENNVAAAFMGVGLHRFVESAELHGENVLRFEAGRAVEERRGMEVYFHEGIAVGALGGRNPFRFGTRRCRTADRRARVEAPTPIG